MAAVAHPFLKRKSGTSVIIFRVCRVGHVVYVLERERVLSTIDDLLDGRLEPVEGGGEVCVVDKVPVERVEEEVHVWVDRRVGEDRFCDQPCEGTVARRRVESGLGYGCGFGSCDLGWV